MERWRDSWKLVTIAMALVAGFVMAEGVASQNVVGYQTITLKPGWNMFSINFAKVGDSDGMLLDEIFPGTVDGQPRPGFTFAATQGNADYVRVWDAQTQTYTENFYLYVRGSNANNYKWMQNASTVAPDNMADMGKGLWYYHKGDTSFTLQFAYPYDLSAE